MLQLCLAVVRISKSSEVLTVSCYYLQMGNARVPIPELRPSGVTTSAKQLLLHQLVLLFVVLPMIMAFLTYDILFIHTSIYTIPHSQSQTVVQNPMPFDESSKLTRLYHPSFQFVYILLMSIFPQKSLTWDT